MTQRNQLFILTAFLGVLSVGCGAEQELFFNQSLQTIIDGLTGELSEDVNSHFFPPDPPDPDPFSNPFSTESFPIASLDSTSSPIDLAEDLETSQFDIRVSLTKAITEIDGSPFLTFECVDGGELDFRDVPVATTTGLVFDGVLTPDELGGLFGAGEVAAPVCQSSDDEAEGDPLVELSIELTIRVKHSKSEEDEEDEDGPVSVITLPVIGTLTILRE